MKRLHCLEALRCAGWDVGFFRDGPFFSPNQTTDLLSSFAGDMWTCFHSIPLHIAASGCVDWHNAQRLLELRKEEQRQKKEQMARAARAEDDSETNDSYSNGGVSD